MFSCSYFNGDVTLTHNGFSSFHVGSSTIGWRSLLANATWLLEDQGTRSSLLTKASISRVTFYFNRTSRLKLYVFLWVKGISIVIKLFTNKDRSCMGETLWFHYIGFSFLFVFFLFKWVIISSMSFFQFTVICSRYS